MTSTVSITDEMLMAYADGELDVATRKQIESEVAASPALAKQVAQYQAMRTQLSGAFSSVLNEPVPDRLQALLAKPAVATIDLAAARNARAEKKGRNPMAFQWMAIAASVIGGVLIGIFAFGNRGNEASGIIVASAQGLVAKGKLARGLTEELASNPNKNSAVQIGLSYVAKSGEYCRTFAMAGEISMTGLACHADSDWRIRMLVPSENTKNDTYRTASSTIPAAVLEAARESISGEPLDADGELRATKLGWKSAAK